MKPRTEGKISYCLVWAIAQLGAVINDKLEMVRMMLVSRVAQLV
jgi:hypothetical protein